MATIKKSDRFTAQRNQSSTVGYVAADLGAKRSAAGLTHFDWVPLDSIAPDPTNERRLGLSVEILKQPLEALDDKIRPVVESLHRFSDALLDQGMINPIQVYARPGGVYEIISGERRYWCSVLNYLRAPNQEEAFARSKVQVKIHHERPRNLKLMQLSENLNREDLPLDSKLRAVEAAWLEWKEANPGKADSGRALARALSLSVTDSGTWYYLLNGDSPLRRAVLRGHIPSLWAVRELRSVSDDLLAKMLPKIAQYGFSETLLRELRSDAASEPGPVKPKKAGPRVRPLVRLPITPKSAQKIYDLLRPHFPASEPVDWSSRAKARKAFLDLLALIDGQD